LAAFAPPSHAASRSIEVRLATPGLAVISATVADSGDSPGGPSYDAVVRPPAHLPGFREAVVADPDWDALRRGMAGELLLPDSPGYELARKPAILNFHDVRPQAVARCRSAADVAEVISFAARSGLPVAPRSGGHCFAGRSSTVGIVIDVGPMRSVSVSDGVAEVGAGARLGELSDALAAHGLAVPAGCGPGVGIAGLTLGGGLGILGRTHGLTSDRLVAAEVVLADGRVVRCDAQRHEDLLWALRGAGGCRFGVVTSLALRTVRAPEEVTTFRLAWPHADAVAVIDAWQAWAPAGPDELAASVLLTAGGDPGRPPLVTVFGAMLGGEAATARVLGELIARAGADPVSDSRMRLPYPEAKRHLAEHGPGEERPGHVANKSEYLERRLPPEAIAALVDNLAAGRSTGEARVLDFTPWGGAYNRVPVDATAFAHRDALMLLKHEVVVDPAAPAGQRQSARRWLARSWELAHPWGTGGVYPNFPDPDLDDWSPAYHGANLARLLRVKASYDPDGVLGPPSRR
jgi:FAD/FMN-containing dehydrogenase